MSQDLDSLSLDALFREARAALRGQQAKAKGPAKAAPSKDSSSPAYYDLSNWTKTRGVALIHQETHTVIGNFTEYIHKAFPGARRLVRETEVLPFTTVEYVTGVWGEPSEPVSVSSTRLWRGAAPATVNVKLKEMRVEAAAVNVSAVFSEGALERVELEQETTFASPPGSEGPRSFCILPQGTNILPEMSIHSIRQLLTNLDQPAP